MGGQERAYVIKSKHLIDSRWHDTGNMKDTNEGYAPCRALEFVRIVWAPNFRTSELSQGFCTFFTQARHSERAYVTPRQLLEVCHSGGGLSDLLVPLGSLPSWAGPNNPHRYVEFWAGRRKGGWRLGSPKFGVGSRGFGPTQIVHFIGYVGWSKKNLDEVRLRLRRVRK